MSSRGMMPPPNTSTSPAPCSASSSTTRGEQGHVGARVDREPDRVGVLLDHGGHDLLGGLVQPGVDDLHAGVAQRPGHHLGTTVVPVQPRLGHHDLDASLRHGAAAPFAVIRRPAPRCRAAPGVHLGRYYPATIALPTPGSSEDDRRAQQRPAAPAASPRPRRPGRLHPPRAAWARKLILRSQLGRGWIVASALFGVVIVVAGVVFLARAGRPGPPWVRSLPSRRPPTRSARRAGPPGWWSTAAAACAPPSGPRPARCPVTGAGDALARARAGQRWDAAVPGPQPPRRPGGPAPAAPGPEPRSRAATCTSTREQPHEACAELVLTGPGALARRGG